MISSYYDGSDVLTSDHGSPNYTRISPSSVANFFSATRQWYGETLLNEPGFEGSDATILGNIVHYFAEQAGKGITVSNATQLVSDYLDTQACENRAEIESLWKDMASTLIAGCITGKPKPTLVEYFSFDKLLPGIYVAGTCDALIPIGNGTYSIRDYKTTATKPYGIPYHYRLQAQVYAYLLTKQGYPVSQIELQYVTRPTKTLPCRHFSFIEPFTDEDLAKVEGQLKLIADSVHTWNTHPELRYLLMQDYRLKPPPPPILFKD